jgi:hypothetical protein
MSFRIYCINRVTEIVRSQGYCLPIGILDVSKIAREHAQPSVPDRADSRLCQGSRNSQELPRTIALPNRRLCGWETKQVCGFSLPAVRYLLAGCPHTRAAISEAGMKETLPPGSPATARRALLPAPGWWPYGCIICFTLRTASTPVPRNRMLKKRKPTRDPFQSGREEPNNTPHCLKG